MDEPNFKSII
jgi:aminopeptidase N